MICDTSASPSNWALWRDFKLYPPLRVRVSDMSDKDFLRDGGRHSNQMRFVIDGTPQENAEKCLGLSLVLKLRELWPPLTPPIWKKGGERHERQRLSPR